MGDIRRETNTRLSFPFLTLSRSLSSGVGGGVFEANSLINFDTRLSNLTVFKRYIVSISGP